MVGYKTGEWISAPPQRKIASKLRTELNSRLREKQKLEEEITKLTEMVEWVEKQEG